MAFGVTPEGFQIKRFEDIRAELVVSFRAVFGEGFVTEPDTAEGQIIDIIAEKIAESWEVLEGVYRSADPDAAEDHSLDVVCSVTGTEREGPEFSNVTATVNVDPGTYAAGTLRAYVDGAPLSIFANSEDVVNGDVVADDIDAVFEAETSGPVVANSGTLTQIASPVVGWNSITNADDAELGVNVDTNSELRIRREEDLRVTGSTNVDAVRAAILAIDVVTYCVVLENDTDEEDGNGLPPHSIECVVFGPESPTSNQNQEVAEVIFVEKAPGIQAFGEDTYEVFDSQNFHHTTDFTRAEVVDLYLQVVVSGGTEATVRAAYVARIEPLIAASRTLLWTKVLDAAYDASGVTNVTSFGIALSGVGPFTQEDRTATVRQKFRIQGVNIDVTVS